MPVARAIRTFGRPVTVVNRSPGGRSAFGEWQEGAETRESAVAAIEPVKSSAEEQLPAGARLEDARCFFLEWTGPAIVSGGEDATATVIEHGGRAYRVASVENWEGHYRKAVAVRITP